MSNENIKRRMNPLIISTLVGVLFVFILLFILFLLPALKVGSPLRDDPAINKTIGQVREDFKIVMDSYTNTIDLVTASFGVIAFLITYQQKRGKLLSTRAWALLCSGVIVLTGALILCLLGREIMLKMIENNSIRFDLEILIYSRWLAYACMAITAVLIGFFAIEVAITPSQEPFVKDFE